MEAAAVEVVAAHHQEVVQGNPCNIGVEDHQIIKDLEEEAEAKVQGKKRNPWIKKLSKIN